MAKVFSSVTQVEFVDLVATFPWTRRMTEVHLHHTWRPRQRDYQGLATIQGMWRFHTETNGWSDIAQHVSIAPDGAIWVGRNFNWTPASSTGFNGNSQAGPFMIEMIGDFDIGQERPTPAQHAATLTVIKAVQDRFGLAPSALRFHNEMAAKSCPGTSFNKPALIEEISAHELPKATRSRNARGGGGELFPSSARRSWDVLRSMSPDAPQADNMAEAEHPAGHAHDGGDGRGIFGPDLTDAMLDELSGHVINLERGAFSDSGIIGTRPEDVDRMFDELIPAYIKGLGNDRRAHLLFVAHGGLVSEKNALLGAYQQLKFWQQNGIYPVFFIWETGFAETIRQMLQDASGRSIAARGPVTDFTDKILEEVVRALGLRRVWGAMQSSAERASADKGGARYTAERLAKLIKATAKDFGVHAMGHSAGAIFHAHLARVLDELNVPVETLQLLAPAVRNDVFVANVGGLIGKGIASTTVYTMRKQLERSDTVAGIYRKSLLYLIYGALEPERQTDILGLEISLRGDHQVRDIFGLAGVPAPKARVVWSRSEDTASGNGSTSATHGDFDNDAPTMESVARRILGRTNGEPIEPFPRDARAVGDIWTGQVDWPDWLEDYVSAVPPDSPSGGSADAAGSGSPPPRPGPGPSTVPGAVATNRRLALCIGIDDYKISPLSGCVADAKLWHRTLEQLGYTVTELYKKAPTAEAIRDGIRQLIASARPGDNLVIQYSGHGTQFVDRDGDEAGGDTPAKDECLVAADYASGSDGLVIDDEIAELYANAAPGVEVTSFFDSCHSGSATRAALRAAAAARAQATARGGMDDVRARFLAPTAEMMQAYQSKVAARRARGSRAPVRGEQRDVLFSACRSDELAYESNGQGDFSLRMTRLVASGNLRGLSNRDVVERILAAFGQSPRQTPQLHCAVSYRGNRFLAL